MDLDLSKPRQRVLRVKLSETKSIDFTLKRVKIKEGKAHSAKIKTLTDALNAGETDGLSFSFDMLKLTCEPFDEATVLKLDEDALGEIWRAVRKLKEMPLEETAEKKT